MSPVNRPVVYSLLTVVAVLLRGIMTVLGVAYQRHQRPEDQTTVLQRNLYQQQSRIKSLQVIVKNCYSLLSTTPADTSRYNTLPAN